MWYPHVQPAPKISQIINMNYQKIYNDIITNAKNSNRIKHSGIYYEEHHIIPQCMNGNDNSDNLVLLTAREHFICHMLLCRIYPKNGKIGYAAFAMTQRTNNHERDYKISARQYDEIKSHMHHTDETKKKISEYNKKYYSNPAVLKHLSDIRKGMNKGNQHNKGKKLSTETKQKMSIAQKKRANGVGFYTGCNHSAETKLLMSEQRKGKCKSEETKQRMRDAWTKRKESEKYNEYITKLSVKSKSHKHTEETKKKLSIIAYNRKFK